MQANRCLFAHLALLLVFGVRPARGESLHATGEGEHSAARIDRLMITLAEDRRGNALLLSTNTEHLRNLLQQHLSPDSDSTCVDHPDPVRGASPRLTPVAIDLLSQQLAAGSCQAGAASEGFNPAGRPRDKVKVEHHATLTSSP
jgi:hypothetical protein